MKSEEIKPIVTSLTDQIVEILIRYCPEVKNHYAITQPSFPGINILFNKVLSFKDLMSDHEIGYLFDISKDAVNNFTLQLNSKTLATCFVFINDEKEANHPLLEEYNNFVYNECTVNGLHCFGYPFDYLITDKQIDGFTPNTYLKFFAKRDIHDEIDIWELDKPGLRDAIIRDGFKIYRNLIVDEVNKKVGKGKIYDIIQEIRQEFTRYSKEILPKYDRLMENFCSINKLLGNEVKRRKRIGLACYLHLPFDSRINNEVIDFLYRSLNDKCFSSTKDNFKSVFSYEETVPIQWKMGLNMFVKLFIGFENLAIDGIPKSFKGLIVNRKDQFLAISKCFDFKNKPKKEMHEYISSKNSQWSNATPHEIRKLWPLFEDLKKWYKD